MVGIILSLLGFVLNIGWFRIIFGIFIIPAYGFYLMIQFKHWFATLEENEVLLRLSFYSNLCMGLSFVLFPDMSVLPHDMTEDSPVYAVFSLYKNPPVVLFVFLALLLFSTSFILLYKLIKLTPPAVNPVWKCPSCNNENAFDHIQCWKCNTPKPEPEFKPEPELDI